MIVEIVVKGSLDLALGNYEKVRLPKGIVFANPVEKRVEVVVKEHPDGKMSVFTDKLEVIKFVLQSAEVIDIHVK